MIAPTSENRIAMTAKEAEGFLYVVSSLGVTGTRSEIKTDLASIVDVVRRNTAIPCAIRLRHFHARAGSPHGLHCGWCHCGLGHREADDPIRQRGPGPRGRICAPDEAGPVTFRLSRSVPFPHGGHSDPISKKNKCKARPRTALLCGSGPGCFFLMSSYGQRVLHSICSLNASSRVASWAGFHSAGSAWSALNAATGTPSSALRRRSTSGSVPHQGRQLRL